MTVTRDQIVEGREIGAWGARGDRQTPAAANVDRMLHALTTVARRAIGDLDPERVVIKIQVYELAPGVHR